MSAGYKTVQWNAHKRFYDLAIACAVAIYLALFILISRAVHAPPRDISTPILLMRALATCALLMLHIILAIGPLARLDDRFAPLLYNRRHLGVTFFLVALAHALVTTLYYGAGGVTNPASAILAGYARWLSISGFPFETLGLAALVIFFLMAATSHDFWLANLTPRLWKWLHMLVYAAYWLVILHVVLGALQSERTSLLAAPLALGALALIVLHALAASREHRKDRAAPPPPASSPPSSPTPWLHVADIDDIPDNAAKLVCLAGQKRVALFRHDAKISAVSDTCAHQGGPLSEGRVINGCITCPWHGYQYLPESGQSPPPFTEKVPTYEVRLEGRRILLNPDALPPGTPTPPARIPTPEHSP